MNNVCPRCKEIVLTTGKFPAYTFSGGRAWHLVCFEKSDVTFVPLTKQSINELCELLGTPVDLETTTLDCVKEFVAACGYVQSIK